MKKRKEKTMEFSDNNKKIERKSNQMNTKIID